MTRHFLRRFILLTGVLSSLVHAYPEITMGKTTIDGSVYSKQKYGETGSALNPDNIFQLPEGYAGTVEYVAGYQYTTDRLSFKLDDFGKFSTKKNPDLQNCIGEAIVSASVPFSYLDIGKKRINQSVSFFRSPINFALDAGYDARFSEGRWMTNLDIFSPVGFFGLSFMPKIDCDSDAEKYASSSQSTQYLLRYGETVLNFDVGVAISKKDTWKAGATLSTTIGNYVELHGEYVLNELKNETKNSWEAVTGITVNLKNASGILEYYFNQSGYDGKTWNDLLRSWKEKRQNYDQNGSNPLSLFQLGGAFSSFSERPVFEHCQHYLMLHLSNPETDNYQLAVNTIFSPEDLSGIFLPSFKYEGWKNISLEGNISIPFGKEYGEFTLTGETWSCGLDMELHL